MTAHPTNNITLVAVANNGASLGPSQPASLLNILDPEGMPIIAGAGVNGAAAAAAADQGDVAKPNSAGRKIPAFVSAFLALLAAAMTL